MKISRNCGLSLKITSTITLIFEILTSGISVALCSLAWINLGRSPIFIYTSTDLKNTASNTRNKSLQACVSFWVLSLILATVVLRILSSIIMAVSIKKRSAPMAKFWIGFKILAFSAATFFTIASMTVGKLTMAAAVFELVSQLLSCYFILILYPELNEMQRILILNIEKKEPL